MRGKALKPLLLTLLFLTLTHARQLKFASSTASCTGGGADDEHFHPGLITCTTKDKTDKWECISTPLHDSFLRIHNTRVKCVKEGCTLEYKLDFTPLAIFVIGFLATLLAGLFLAVAMYLAVVRMAGRYGCEMGMESERERFGGLRRAGYGSFGGKLYRLGQCSDSFKSLLEFDVEDELQGDVETGDTRDRGKEMENEELVEREIYLG